MNSKQGTDNNHTFLGQKMLDKISKGIDAFNNKMGEVTALLIIPLLTVIIYEVFMRYAFNAPTVWGFEATTFLYGIHFMFGLAYTEVHSGHVKVDIFTVNATTKVRAALGALTTLVLFLPMMTCLAYGTATYAVTSIEMLELNSTSWAPPIYPFKAIMAITISFLLLQGVSNLIRDLRILFGNND